MVDFGPMERKPDAPLIVRRDRGKSMHAYLRRSMYALASLGLCISVGATAQSTPRSSGTAPPPTDCQPGYAYGDNNSCNTPLAASNVTLLEGGIGTGFVSQDHRFYLTFQSDGNVVLYMYPNTFDNNRGGRTVLWTSNSSIPVQPSGQMQPYFIWQSDGNLVARAYATYTDSRGVVWASGTAGRGATLTVQNDGNAVIYDSAGGVVWATNTCCH